MQCFRMNKISAEQFVNNSLYDIFLICQAKFSIDSVTDSLHISGLKGNDRITIL